ncbi:hypothetical protein K437DRAFT_99345 [Tilletiaria anomala UBC 951]|uniref:Uncharacterized protein n=1 Tax=Tilletiaria anomala (strain ATCC 24038 / CBS 436.72 / UBC 951) TaxID=1037660 RepID=A0A066W0S2_TILAU|nr:uncharacterized protein K437DRAFT_99345 [Tilletiaria anomala UBC 951]KDN47321.1 hypothetical protein K437DRAFT_99345 [Tilletiaria anomala UBC 951]
MGRCLAYLQCGASQSCHPQDGCRTPASFHQRRTKRPLRDRQCSCAGSASSRRRSSRSNAVALSELGVEHHEIVHLTGVDNRIADLTFRVPPAVFATVAPRSVHSPLSLIGARVCHAAERRFVLQRAARNVPPNRASSSRA